MKESIFKAAIKSFFKGFFFVLGIFLVIISFFFFAGTFLAKEEKSDINILPDLEGNTKILSQKSPVILKINIKGIIGEKNLTTEDIENILIDSRKNIFKKNRTKAILLHISTPGGGVNDSDGIYQSLLRYKKKYKVPIYTYVDGLCASGGFYIASASDKIYSNPVSIIGSVGVLLGPFFNVFETLDKIGVKTKTLTQGKDKDTLNPFREWKEKEDESLKDIASYTYDRFVSIISKQRNISKDLIINTYGAHIFDAKKAKEIGYIDEDNASYQSTLRDLIKEAKIETPYQVIEIEPKKKWSELFLKNSLLKGKIKHKIKVPYYLKKRDISYLYIP